MATLLAVSTNKFLYLFFLTYLDQYRVVWLCRFCYCYLKHQWHNIRLPLLLCIALHFCLEGIIHSIIYAINIYWVSINQTFFQVIGSILTLVNRRGEGKGKKKRCKYERVFFFFSYFNYSKQSLISRLWNF